jgi:hypothetical protein
LPYKLRHDQDVLLCMADGIQLPEARTTGLVLVHSRRMTVVQQIAPFNSSIGQSWTPNQAARKPPVRPLPDSCHMNQSWLGTPLNARLPKTRIASPNGPSQNPISLVWGIPSRGRLIRRKGSFPKEPSPNPRSFLGASPAEVASSETETASLHG